MKSRRYFSVLLFISLLLVLVSLLTGRYPLDYREILNPDHIDHKVFMSLRLGRTCMVILTGTALGMAGYVFQTVFHNPLAAPDVAGVASGASAGAALAILLFSGNTVYTASFAFAGGALAMLLVLGLYSAVKSSGISSLVVCGVCVNALFQALLTLLKTTADRENVLAAMEFWTMGSFADITLSRFFGVLPWTLAGMAGLIVLQQPIRLLAFGEDEAAMLGIHVNRTRLAALTFSTLAVSSVISAVGLVSFAGLLAPHIARRLNRAGKNGLFSCGLTGTALLLVADILSRCVSVREMPISVWTSLLGVPVLFVLLCRRKRYEQ